MFALKRLISLLLTLGLLCLLSAGARQWEAGEQTRIDRSDRDALNAVVIAVEQASTHYFQHGRSFQELPVAGPLQPGSEYYAAGDPLSDPRLAALPTVRATADPERVYLHVSADGQEVTVCAIAQRGSTGYCRYKQKNQPDRQAITTSAVREGSRGQVQLGTLALSAIKGRSRNPRQVIVVRH